MPYGIELGTIAERMDRFEEAVEVIVSMLREPRTTFDEGKYYRLNDAPNQPAPLQERLPILIGGGGEKRTLRIAARWADEWNTWSTPEVLSHKTGVLRSRCDEVGRDPSDIKVSTQAMLFLSTDESWLAGKRDASIGQAAIVGTPEEVVETVSRYKDAGADELIVPGFNLGSTSRSKDTCDLFINEVAPHLR